MTDLNERRKTECSKNVKKTPTTTATKEKEGCHKKFGLRGLL